MKRTNIILALLAVLTLTAQTAAGQVKTATIKGYSPALKDGTLVLSGTGSSGAVVDTVQSGRFAFTLPVEELSVGFLALIGEGCPRLTFSLMMKPDVTVNMTGMDCLYPLWNVESPIPEQQTLTRITEHCRDVITELIQAEQDKDWNKHDTLTMKLMGQELDILPSLPVDAASISKLTNSCRMLKNIKDFPYMEQLKRLEKDFAARAPKEFENQLAEIHTYIYPPHLLQVGEEAVDAELFDFEGNTHHLLENLSDGRYVLLDFWSVGCGPCLMSEPEMKEVYEQLKGKLEIVGINQDKLSTWKNNDFSKRIVWKNWNDGKMGSSINSRYCDIGAIPYYVLISPDKRIVWKAVGYGPGWFYGLADAINGRGIKQDNSANLNLSILKVDANRSSTTVSFRYYTKKGNWFIIAKDSYLIADGKKYKLTSADGIELDVKAHPDVKASTSTGESQSNIYYKDFTLTFEPFDTIPTTFDYKEGDGERTFVIRRISIGN